MVHTNMWTVYTNVCTSYMHCPSPYHRPFPSIICVSQLSGAISWTRPKRIQEENGLAGRQCGYMVCWHWFGDWVEHDSISEWDHREFAPFHSWEAKKCGRMEAISSEGTPLMTSLPPLYLISSRFQHLLKAPQIEDHWLTYWNRSSPEW